MERLVEAATGAGVEVHVPPEEIAKHGLAANMEQRRGVVLASDGEAEVDLAVVLGGDGSILRALRRFAGCGVPVFSFNFGAVGFLATVDREELEEGISRALAGDYEVIPMPALAITPEGQRRLGVNDISLHRRSTARVAELACAVEGQQLARVRCDGLVAATPGGSTGYNLANGGPVLAWGVEGFVLSFIAPHTLTARALVVAPDDVLEVTNLSRHEEIDITTDGDIIGALGPGESLDVRFERDAVSLAQLPDSTFYRRLREKFGRLAY